MTINIRFFVGADLRRRAIMDRRWNIVFASALRGWGGLSPLALFQIFRIAEFSERLKRNTNLGWVQKLLLDSVICSSVSMIDELGNIAFPFATGIDDCSNSWESSELSRKRRIANTGICIFD